MKKIISFLQWVLAFILAVLVINMLCFLYFRAPGWVQRSGNATDAIWEPQKYIIKGDEGFGINYVDSNGYVNPEKQISGDELILCMGASFLQGKEVMQSDKYTSLLDKLLYNEADELHVYNLSKDAYFYPEIVSGVYAAIQEFPQTSILIIDLHKTDFSFGEMNNALQIRQFSYDEVGVNKYDSISSITKLKNVIKDYFPIINCFKSQMAQVTKSTSEEKTEVDYLSEEYRNIMFETVKVLRNSFSDRIIVLFHPSVSLDETGEMILQYSESFEYFTAACEEYGIEIVDVGNSFLQKYHEEYIVPYGFLNTRMGEGHINKAGHEIIANELYEYLVGGDN